MLPTFLQTTEALVDELDAAWKFFGGFAHRVVLDNTSAAIVRASAQDPTIKPSFAEYAQVRGFFIDPARVRHPRDKARVENQVPFVRERWPLRSAIAERELLPENAGEQM